jgi:hypothetical protein
MQILHKGKEINGTIGTMAILLLRLQIATSIKVLLKSESINIIRTLCCRLMNDIRL